MKFRPILSTEIGDFLSHKQLGLFGLVKSFGSPLNITFPDKLIENAISFNSIFQKNQVDGKIFYACKANKAESFLEVCAYSDIGVEVSSIFELRKALSRGVDGDNIIISGPSKTKSFLCLGIRRQCYISIDDISELNLVIKIVLELGLPVPKIILRINNLGKRQSRFGVRTSELNRFFDLIKDNSLDLLGYSFHLSGYSANERSNAIHKLIPKIDAARDRGFSCDIIDIGGGFPVDYIKSQDWEKFCVNKKMIKSPLGRVFNTFYPYHNNHPKSHSLDEILNYSIGGEKVKNALRERHISLFVEPGRSLLDQAGITLVEIKSIKKNDDKKNIINVDSNINNLSEQWFETEFLVDPILIKKRPCSKEKFKGMIAGNLCLENDLLSWREVEFSSIPERGDLLAFINTAGYQMDTNESSFHLLPLPAKIACNKNQTKWHWVKDENYSFCERNN